MKALAPESPSAQEETLRLPIRDLAHMFNAPAVDPLSPGLPEALGISGAEYLLQEMEVGGSRKLRTVQLLVLRDKLDPDLARRAEEGLRRYAECRILQQQVLIRGTRRHGWRLLAAAIVLLAFFLTLSSLFASEWTEGLRPLYRKTLEYGFEIVGWVMLWYPIEVLVLQPIAIRGRIKALRRLTRLRVAAVAEDTEIRAPA